MKLKEHLKLLLLLIFIPSFAAQSAQPTLIMIETASCSSTNVPPPQATEVTEVSKIAATSPPTASPYSSKIHILSVPNGLLAAVLIINGISFCFFGVRYVQSSLFLTGFYSTAIISFITILQITLMYGIPARESNDWIYTVLIPAFSILGGLLTLYFVRLACILIGSLFMYLIVILLLFIGLGNLLPMSGLIVCYIVSISTGAILSYFQEWFCVVGGSALTGSMSVFLGIDVFVGSGFIETVVQVMLQGKTGPSVSGLVWGFLSLVIIFAIFGSVTQNVLPVESKMGNSRMFPRRY